MTDSETLQVLEIQKTMATTDFRSEFTSFREVMESKLDVQNSKYNLLIGLMTGGLTVFAIIVW